MPGLSEDDIDPDPVEQLRSWYEEAGTVTMVTREESERDWRARSRASQLGAWVSRQSEVIESRAVLGGDWASCPPASTSTCLARRSGVATG